MPSVRMPALFIGHGTPMNALEDNEYTRIWRELGRRLPRPKAILAVSAHWETRGTAVTAVARPPTIHDFGGFPQALFDMQYPAPGSAELVERVKALLAPKPVASAQDWGLDHGTWSVLVHVFPEADVPVIQLSIDATKPPSYHLELGKRLGALRDQGVLVLGSGNIVHNLRRADFGLDTGYDWAVRFDAAVRARIEAGDHAELADWSELGPDARLAVPTPEHYLPLLYALGAQQPGDDVRVFNAATVLGSISMTSVVVGPAAVRVS